MRELIVVAATTLLLAGCNRSGAPAAGEVDAAPAIADLKAGDAPEDTALTNGVYSLTSAEARVVLEQQGYTEIGPLIEDDQGAWSAPAVRNEAQTMVSVDGKGQVSMRSR